MNKRFLLLLVFVILLVTDHESYTLASQPAPNLPVSNLPLPVSNNAVASLEIKDEQWIASFNGLGSAKDWKSVTNSAFLWHSKTNQWLQLPDVPGKKGRLASTAVTMKQTMWIIGGYTVAEDGEEVSTPDIYSIAPPWKSFQHEAKMPTPVDDTVALVSQQQFLILVSGWFDKGNVDKIQIYDNHKKLWKSELTFPGVPVFGHTGALIDNKILIVDGVGVVGEKAGKRQFAAINQTWLGEFKDKKLSNITWKKLPPHPGKARYRMGSLVDKKRGLIIFVGGSDNPYNYNGIGYNDEPSKPVAELLIFDVKQSCWLNTSSKGVNVMDLRGVIAVGNRILAIGGMNAQQKVLKQVSEFDLDSVEVGECIH